MKQIMSGLLLAVAFFVASCAGIPSVKKEQKRTLAVEIVQVESPRHYDMTKPEFPEMLSNPEILLCDEENTVTRYPVLYAEEGGSVTNDQTEAASYVDGYTIVDGNGVPEEHVHKVGLLISATISEIRRDIVTLQLNIQNKQLFGYSEETVDGGLRIKRALFDSQSYSNPVTLSLGNWLVLGGLLNERTSLNDTSYSSVYMVRVVEPEQ